MTTARYMDLAVFERHHPTIDLRLAGALVPIVGWIFDRKGVSVEVENRARLGSDPLILATNATHQYDLLPIRYALHRCARPATTLSKGKNFHGLFLRTVCKTLGSVPLISRGYIIAADFRSLFGRRPSEGEYRALRDHIDTGVPLPGGPPFEEVANRPRSVLGLPFDPNTATYRECVHDLYRTMMHRTEELCSQAVDEGHDLHMFPQGSSATRLSAGHIGAVQLAHALDLPIAPVGVSGCLEVFPETGRLTMRSGQVRLRIGEPFVPDLAELPDDFEPFDPDHERAQHAVLTRETDRLMEQINDLLDPAYRWAPDRTSDGAAGTRRFV